MVVIRGEAVAQDRSDLLRSATKGIQRSNDSSKRKDIQRGVFHFPSLSPIDRGALSTPYQVPPKAVHGRAINGGAFLILAKSYLKAINEGAVPTINSAWER